MVSTSASTTADQISIRAAWDAGRIRYSVDDEYGTTFVCAITESERPLTMGEVIRLIDDNAVVRAASQVEHAWR